VCVRACACTRLRVGACVCVCRCARACVRKRAPARGPALTVHMISTTPSSASTSRPVSTAHLPRPAAALTASRIHTRIGRRMRCASPPRAVARPPGRAARSLSRLPIGTRTDSRCGGGAGRGGAHRRTMRRARPSSLFHTPHLIMRGSGTCTHACARRACVRACVWVFMSAMRVRAHQPLFLELAACICQRLARILADLGG
jgi:hypothetical protein